MQILFLTERYPPDIGGVATSAARMVRVLARMGHEVHVFCLVRHLPSGYVESHQEEARLTVHRCGSARSVDFTMQQAVNFLQWLHRQQTFQLLWGHFVENSGFLAAWLGRLWGVPSLLSVRGNDFDRQLFPPGDIARLEWCLRTAKRIVTVSRDMADKVRALVQRDAVVLPNTVDTAVFHPGEKPADLLAQYGLGSQETVLVFSGELRAKKGLGFLLTALRQVLSWQPARLLIIGAVRAADRGEYTRVVHTDPSIEAHIVLTGHMDDPVEVARHLRLGDIFLLPSLWEGMPNSLLEAMATGIPVLASDAGGIPEVVQDGVNGLLMPHTHLHRLAEHIKELLDFPAEQRRAITAAARQTILRHYTLLAEEARLAAVLTGMSGEAST